MSQYLSIGAVPVMGPVPSSNWTSSSNICKPMNAETLAAYKELQSQLNRLAAGVGASKTAVDGRIGPGTLKLYNAVTSSALTRCDQLSSLVSSGMLANLKAKADAAGAPVAVAPPILSIPSTVNAAGVVTNPPDALAMLSIGNDLFGLVTSPFGLLIAAGLGYGAYRLAKTPVGGSSKRRGGKRAARRAPSRRKRTTRRRRTARRRR